VSCAVASRCIIHLEPTWLDDANFILHQAKVKGYSPSICGIIGEITPRRQVILDFTMIVLYS
jgi:hypothetical protein